MKRARREVAPMSSNDCERRYGVLLLVFDFVAFVVSIAILCVVSIFMAVSIAVGVGAGAMAGVVVSAGVLSAFEQAVNANIAATRAKRFMQILL
jgi:uncharacterized transporter YbjL